MVHPLEKAGIWRHRHGSQVCRARPCIVRTLCWAVFSTVAVPAPAFVVVPTDRPGEYLKWGASNVAGSPGGVVTWGFVAAGTPGSVTCGAACVGSSLELLPNFYATPSRDNRTTPISLPSLRATFQAAFDAWSTVADVQFQYAGVDNSLKPINDPTATSPQIRIGVYSFEGRWAYCQAAVAFAAPPNVGTVAGDIFLNANVGYQLSSAAEGSEVSPFPAGNGLYMTDLYLLALHEIGHAIGLGDTADPESVLWNAEPSSASLRRVNLRRHPQADDIAGAQFLYGPPKAGIPREPTEPPRGK